MPCAVGFAAFALAVLVLLHCLVSRRRARRAAQELAQELEAQVAHRPQRTTAVLVLNPGPAIQVKKCLGLNALLVMDE